MAPTIPTGIDATEACSSNYFSRDLEDHIPNMTAATEYSIKADGNTIDMELTIKNWESPFCPKFAGIFSFAYCDVTTFKARHTLFMDEDIPKYKAETCDDTSGDMTCKPYRNGNGNIDAAMIFQTEIFLLAMIKSGEDRETIVPIWDFLMACIETLKPAAAEPKNAPRTGLSFISNPLTLIDPIWANAENFYERLCRSLFLDATISAVRKFAATPAQ